MIRQANQSSQTQTPVKQPALTPKLDKSDKSESPPPATGIQLRQPRKPSKSHIPSPNVTLPSDVVYDLLDADQEVRDVLHLDDAVNTSNSQEYDDDDDDATDKGVSSAGAAILMFMALGCVVASTVLVAFVYNTLQTASTAPRFSR
eukprot:GHVN01032226.1.p1 GENE.GHVN01032226.1~~GHVN01032226.1.p1  ORF type:complete len:146 (+),score=32.57 GHVN01032226.1:295-732(+)